MRQIRQIVQERLELIDGRVGWLSAPPATALTTTAAGWSAEQAADDDHPPFGKKRHDIGGFSELGNAGVGGQLGHVVLAGGQRAHAILQRLDRFVAAKRVLAEQDIDVSAR